MSAPTRRIMSSAHTIRGVIASTDGSHAGFTRSGESNMVRAVESHFDSIADTELQHLLGVLDEMDPDEVEVELSMGVLNITLSGGERIVINSHRAAGQIWMAAFQRAWHFSPHEEDGRVFWRTPNAELRSTLASLLSERLGRQVAI